jgi:DNA-binding NarL/FixJ family response regulator
LSAQIIRVLVVDDHPVVRFGILGMLSGYPDLIVVGEASDGESAAALAIQHHPNVILMDLRMPTMGGVEAMRRILQQLPTTRVLILTTYDRDHDINAALEAGAVGYLLKDTPRDDLYQAVKAAAQGRRVLSSAVTQRLIDQLQHPSDALTEREIMVLTLAARGDTNKVIGKKLHISAATVKTHLKHIYDKLGVADRAAAVAIALERQIIHLDQS